MSAPDGPRAAQDGAAAALAGAEHGPLIRLPTVQRQAGALAWLPGPPLRFVLVTSRRTRRWVFPKGGIEDGQSGAETAAREAREEAGIVGRAEPLPLGSFRCDKIRPPHVWTLDVELFALAVEEIRDDWPEATQRERRLATLAEARDLLSDPAMLALAERFAASLEDPGTRS